jgi:hypothetical protein
MGSSLKGASLVRQQHEKMFHIIAVTFVVSRSGASAKHIHYVLIYAQIVGCEKTKIWGDRGSKDVQSVVRGRGSADQRENERVVG